MTGTGPTGRGRDGRTEGGIPDGLLVGLLGFLLTLTVLVWTAAGLSAIFSHGSWPSGIGFTHTPMAMRHLVTDPRDLATAWPDAEGQLSGPGLFWGIFIGELMVLVVLAVFVAGTVARWRAVRRRSHDKAAAGPDGATGGGAFGPAREAWGRAGGAPGAAPPHHPGSHGVGAPPPGPYGAGTHSPGPYGPATGGPGSHGPGSHGPADGPGSHGSPGSHEPGARVPGSPGPGPGPHGYGATAQEFGGVSEPGPGHSPGHGSGPSAHPPTRPTAGDARIPAATAEQQPGGGTAHRAPRQHAYGPGTEGSGDPHPEASAPTTPGPEARSVAGPGTGQGTAGPAAAYPPDEPSHAPTGPHAQLAGNPAGSPPGAPGVPGAPGPAGAPGTPYGTVPPGVPGAADAPAARPAPASSVPTTAAPGPAARAAGPTTGAPGASAPARGPQHGPAPPWGVHFTGAAGAARAAGGPAARRALALRTVTEAAGPLLVVTSDPALWAETKDARGKLGPTHLYDPGQLLDTPARLRWSPVTGCASRDVAARRASALLAPVRPPSALDSAMAETAETLLRSWLHAAAVDDRPFRQVHRWASGAAAHEPVRILRTNTRAAGGSAGELEGALTGYPERRELAQELTARALSALSSIHIRNACNPTRADTLALESFVAEGGTLYVVGESIEDPRVRPGAMPFLTALVSAVVEHGRRMAERRPGGWLDPPFALVLDDVAAVAPLPELPDLVASGAARGLPTLALLRSEEQARARWPRHSLVP